jgi:hypothetical protein
MVVSVNTIKLQVVDVEIRLPAWNDQVELLVVEQREPFGFEHFQEPFAETSCFLFQLLVALVVAVGHDELQLILSTLS